MNFWHMQLHPNDKSAFNRGEIKNLLVTKKVIGLGEKWENDRGQPQKFSTVMQVGDIILIRSEGPLALVKVISPCYENTDDSIWYDIIRDVEILSLDGNFYKNHYKAVFSSSWNDSLYLSTTIEVANNSDFIKFWYKDINGKVVMDNAISLLKYKHQIILQGPPGTGKTRLAKILAQALINSQAEINNQDYFDQVLIKFNADDQVQKNRQTRLEALNQFQKKFPKEDLEKMTLESYCMGRGDKNNFCYWIQSGLKDLGNYPSFTDAFLIFWKNDIYKYSKHGFVKDINDDNEVMSKVAGILSEIINDRKFDKALKILGDGFILKLLNSYYPDEYFPINNEKKINTVLNIFNISFNDKNLIQKNKEIFKIYLNKKEKYNLDITPFEFSDLLFQTFNLDTGEVISSIQNNYIQNNLKIVQFHPAYSYEDFVRGIVAKTNENGTIAYNVENKILAEFAKKAQDNPNEKYVLIIDEINRANLPSVLGELIYGLEYRGEPVTTMYELEGESQIILPKNLYIIGTMNTADRSVGHIDYAIRRRFAFVNVLPDETVIGNERARNIFNKVGKLFEEHKSTEFHKDDVMIGHSYFIVKDEAELKIKLEYEIKPILKEYLKDGILLDSAEVYIDNLKV